MTASPTRERDTIYVLDYGSQYSHLIVRRIRELGVFAELVPHNVPLTKLETAAGVILSGGPQNLSESTALRIDKKVFDLGTPILGICYGLQLTAHELGGKVTAGARREYGPVDITVTQDSPLLSGLPQKQRTWMSHSDQVTKLPKGFHVIASSLNCQYAAIADPKRHIYGLQFHPEVTHTTHGLKILQRWLAITGAKKSWSMKDFIAETTGRIRTRLGKDKAVCALSGGVDSAVAATLVHRAIGQHLTCIYVDTGLMRAGETQQIEKTFRGYQNMRLIVVKAEKEFLKALRGGTDPEKKRKIIGTLFIRIFERKAKELGRVKWLVQGTLYPDVITSGVSMGKTAAVIKSHHNVGGLPKKLGFKLIEPLRELYKDEVRKIGGLLKLPPEITQRQPFPGPGLAIRIIGEVTKEKLELLRAADSILREEIEKAGAHKNIQQYFAVLPSIKSVGVQGDSRSYGYPIILRAVTTADFMTANWAHLPADLLERISARITNEVRGINRVAYDITSKPPATVEWE